MRRSSTIVEEEDGDVNVTPLLDIVFIMLIFFIVTSVFIKEPGAEVTRPPADVFDETNPAILVAITPDNEIWIDGDEVEIDAVGITVQRLRAENPKGGAVIQADENSEAKFLVDVMDQINNAGVTEVHIATRER